MSSENAKALGRRMRLDPDARREIGYVLSAEECSDLDELEAKPAVGAGLSGADIVAMLAEQYVEIEETHADTQQWYADNLRPAAAPEATP